MSGSSKRIIFISRRQFPVGRIQQYFALEHQKNYDIRLLSDFAATEDYLFDPEYTLRLIVADFCNNDLFKDIRLLKNDEIFRFLPVLGIIPKVSAVTLATLIDCGCEHYLEETHLQTSLPEYMRIILWRSEHLDEMALQVSRLQEKGIRDFILLDIIKNYIPRTIWHKAEDFAEEQRLELNSEETELAICFGDICSFSTLSQYKQPKEVVEMLNVVFEVATRYIFHFSGDVDKFIGDAFLAIFSDSRQAIAAIYGIQKELAQLNQSKAQNGEEIVQFRIGIHVGKIIRGNVGGNDRYDNTLIGDTVNTASRLEGKAPHGGFVISEAVRECLGLAIPEQYRMSSELKGRAGEEVYYSMLDYLDEYPEAIPGLCGDIEAARDSKGKRIQELHKDLQRTDEVHLA